MKNLIYILTFLLSGVVFGQSGEFRDNAISSNFSTAEINAYQESADKKVEDFYSYLNLLSNKEISQKAKTEIKENILLLFKYSETTIVDFTSATPQKLRLSAFLDKVENQEIQFNFTEKKKSVPKLYYDFWLSEYAVEVKFNREKSVKNISQAIYFSPVYKQFGSTYKEVWEIKLGEME